MFANGKLPPLPLRDEVVRQIERLLVEADARESVANWAQKWIIDSDSEREYPIPDEKVWEMLNALMGADAKDSPTTYLHDKVDFEDWLNEILSAP